MEAIEIVTFAASTVLLGRSYRVLNLQPKWRDSPVAPHPIS